MSMMYTYCMLENTEDILLIVAGLFMLLFLALRLTAWNRQPRRASLPRNELSPSEEQLKNANNAERAVNFFRIFTLRTNKALVGLSALVLAVLTTFFMPETALQWLGWFLACAAILVSQATALH